MSFFASYKDAIVGVQENLNTIDPNSSEEARRMYNLSASVLHLIKVMEQDMEQVKRQLAELKRGQGLQ